MSLFRSEQSTRRVEVKSNNLLPLEVIENFDFNVDWNRFPPPFASEKEALGFLSGSEGKVLCTKNESIFSQDFVQCVGALIRNRKSGLVFVIHQSEWSGAASAILCAQRQDDLDVIKINGPKGKMMEFQTITNRHNSDPKEFQQLFQKINRNDFQLYGKHDPKHLKHAFLDRSAIKGLTTEELENLFKQAVSMSEDSFGATNLIGTINIPVPREKSNRWSMLYRPAENIVWIYDSGAKKLFKYAGFPNQ